MKLTVYLGVLLIFIKTLPVAGQDTVSKYLTIDIVIVNNDVIGINEITGDFEKSILSPKQQTKRFLNTPTCQAITKNSIRALVT